MGVPVILVTALLAVFLLGVAAGVVLGVAIAARGQSLDEDLDRLYALMLAQEAAEEAELDRLYGEES